MVSTPFSSPQEADNAYYGSGGTPDSPNTTASWGKIQSERELKAGFVLAYQNEQGGDRTRWFVYRLLQDDSLEFINSAGKTKSATENDTYSELPHYETESDAIEAYEKWLEANGSEQDGQNEAWEKWSKITEEPPWHIYSRTHKEEDRVQFLATSTLEDGSAVYLAPGGEVVDEPHPYDNAESLQQALRDYFKRAENGDIPEDRRPTGGDPGAEVVRNQAATASSGSGGLVEAIGGPKVALAVVAVGGVAAYKATDGDLFGGN